MAVCSKNGIYYNIKMKKFSNKWNSSKSKRKQRKYRFQSPIHKRHILISSNLSKELRKKYGKRSFPLRKNDSVIITTGEFKKKKGKITKIDSYNLRVYIEGIQKSKKDGTKVYVPINPSNLQITELDLQDKKRIISLERKK